jgi:hypothetical protein
MNVFSVYGERAVCFTLKERISSTHWQEAGLVTFLHVMVQKESPVPAPIKVRPLILLPVLPELSYSCSITNVTVS